MNERIRELVRQAGLDDADFPIENWDNVPLSKFAKLIVQECADLCDRFQARNVGMQSAECAGAIRQLFGVKE